MTLQLDDTDLENATWENRYRPKRIEDVILPTLIKRDFMNWREKGELPNLLLSGRPGIGKTTVTLAVLAELGSDVYKLNGSFEVNIDTLRHKITSFAGTVSFAGGRKYIFLDEADYLAHNIQPPLRGILDEYSQNASFIFTANYPERLIEPLRSRCVQIEFRYPPEELIKLKAEYFRRLCAILENEKVVFDKAVLAQVVERYFPDMRQALYALQRYANSGPIDNGILAVIKDASIDELILALRKRSYSQARKWIVNNLDAGSQAIFRRIYDSAREFVTPESLPQLVIILGKYQYQLSFVADSEINMAACVAEIIGICHFLPG